MDQGNLNEKTISHSSSFFQKLSGLIFRISLKEKLFFLQNLHIMIKSGLSLNHSLATLAYQTRNKSLKKILTDISENTKRGLSFHRCLEMHPDLFGQMGSSMIKAGEMAGQLESILLRLYIQTKNSYELKSRVKSALIYPVIVVTAMVGIGIAMMVFVVPKMISIFNEVKVELPLATRILIATSNFIQNHGIILGTAIIIFIVGIVLFLKQEFGKQIFHKIITSLPVFGPLVIQYNLAIFSRSMSSLLKTDIPIVECVNITSQTIQNRTYKKILFKSIGQLKAGLNLSEELKTQEKYFPPIFVQMMTVGEETGNVDELLGELATFYEEEIDRAMKSLPTIIEPILMVIIGAAVAGMAMAILMPMQSITQSI